MTSLDIYRALLHRWDPRKDLIIPRCCVAGWEADLLIIKPSGWAEEIEVKISLADFRREWTAKQEKHEALELGRRKFVGYSLPDGTRGAVRLDGESVDADPTLHSVTQGRYTTWHVRRPGIIRRFWFALPQDLAERVLPEVPEAYGVLGVGARGWPQELRKPTNLVQARKLTPVEKLAALTSTYYRWWDAERARLHAGEMTLDQKPEVVAP